MSGVARTLLSADRGGRARIAPRTKEDPVHRHTCCHTADTRRAHSHRRALLLALLVTGFASSLVPARVGAQMSTGELTPSDDGSPALAPGTGYRGSRIAGELGYFTVGNAGRDVHLFAPSVYGSVRLVTLSSSLDLGLDFGLRGLGAAGTSSIFRAGNGYLGASLGVAGDGFRTRVGAGVALPFLNAYSLETLSEALELAVAVNYMTAMWGGWDTFYATRGYLPIVVRGDFEWRGELFFAGAQGGAALYVPVVEEASHASLTLQLGLFAGLRPIEGLALGVRAQAVYSHSFGPPRSDEGQLALMPFVRGELGQGFIEGRLLMNLDEPYGFAFDTGKVWALSVTGGANF